MERSSLKALGLTVEQIDFIMTEYGKDVKEYKDKLDEASANTQKLTETEAKLKTYEKGGDHYIDAEEFKRLQAFEQTTIAEKKTNAVKSALTEVLQKNKVTAGAQKLLLKLVNADEVELDEKTGKVTEAYEKKYIEALKAESEDYFEKVNTGAGIPNAPQGTATKNATGVNNHSDSEWAQSLAEHYKI